jgi:arginyl-tRNA synthetase
MHLPVSISHEINEHFLSHLQDNPEDYICVYGSSVYSPDKLTSDVDLFAVTHGVGKLALDPLVSFIKDLHIRHGRHLDAEVPYENKVHYTAAEVEDAVQFGGFEVQSSHITVPPVRKESAFLQSPAIKARLALNGLTTPHVVFGEDFRRYHIARERAGEAAALLAISLIDRQEVSVPLLRDALTVSETGASGEMFLGYKTQYPIVNEHLSGVLEGGLVRLSKHGVVNPTLDGYQVPFETFDPLGYMRATAPQ